MVITFIPFYRYTVIRHKRYLKFTVIPQNFYTVSGSYNMVKMTKRKTSISIDTELWKEWTKFVIDKTGSARKLSEEIENALRAFMRKG